MKHVLSVLVNNEPGVLARVASLFGRRNFNIDSICVGETETPGISRMIIVTSEDSRTMEQVKKQLHKLIDVIKVQELSESAMVARELMLVKVDVTPSTRSEVNGILEPFRAAVVDVSPNTVIVQATGNREKLDALVEVLHPYGIKEISRTGLTAMTRGSVKNSFIPHAAQS